MYRLTRHVSRLFLYVLMPIILAACGNNSSGPSSGVLSGHSAVDVGGTVWTFGANGFGQLGNGSTNDSHTPVNVGNYTEVAIGGGHTVALNSDGTVSTWGYNSNGQLGNGTTSNSTTPVRISIPGKTIIHVAAGARFTLALATDGTNKTVYAWGNNNRGQLGNGITTDSSSPVQVIVLPSNIIMIAAGGEFGLASDGTNVWAWGSNDDGQLGNGTTASSATPVQITGFPPTSTAITMIAAGGSHSLAVTKDSSNITTLYAWGYNAFGQLGNGASGSSTVPSSGDQHSPVIVSGISGQITSISAGLDHSLAVIGGSVYAWGHNFNGQLGNSAVLFSDAPFTTPQRVLDQNGIQLTNFASVIATGNHSIAIDNSGHIWTWGDNTYGELGDGTTTTRSTAMVIPGH